MGKTGMPFFTPTVHHPPFIIHPPLPFHYHFAYISPPYHHHFAIISKVPFLFTSYFLPIFLLFYMENRCMEKRKIIYL